MKRRDIILLAIFIAIYLIAASVLFLKMQISKDLLMHFIFAFWGMLGLLVLNVKYPSGFVSFLTMIAFLFYGFSSFSGILFSLARNDFSAFQNMGVLANTEGFMFVVVLGYLIIKSHFPKIQ